MRNFHTFKSAEEENGNYPELIVDLDQIVAAYETFEDWPGAKAGPKIGFVLECGQTFYVTNTIGFDKFKEWFFEELQRGSKSDEPERGSK